MAQLLHLQIQQVMSEVFSAGLTKTYTPYWILLHEVIIAEGQISEMGAFFKLFFFPSITQHLPNPAGILPLMLMGFG